MRASLASFRTSTSGSRTLRSRRIRRSVVAAGCALLSVTAACAPMPVRTVALESVDLNQYVGKWYEIASVKQFFSVGLVGTTAEYTPLPDGTIQVINRGRFSSFDGPEAAIEGRARPTDSTNAKLSVTFNGSFGPSNYWIVALDESYQWAVVSDGTGSSAFFLSRTPSVSTETYAEMYAKAQIAGVDLSNLTPTTQQS